MTWAELIKKRYEGWLYDDVLADMNKRLEAIEKPVMKVAVAQGIHRQEIRYLTNQVSIYDLIVEDATGQVMRWHREGRPTPQGFTDFFTDNARAYAIMRRKLD